MLRKVVVGRTDDKEGETKDWEHVICLATSLAKDTPSSFFLTPSHSSSLFRLLLLQLGFHPLLPPSTLHQRPSSKIDFLSPKISSASNWKKLFQSCHLISFFHDFNLIQSFIYWVHVWELVTFQTYLISPSLVQERGSTRSWF